MKSAVALERFSGCLIGQCLGDAAGFPVEGMPPDVCKEYVRTELRDRVKASSPGGPGAFVFGQYTDDSQLAREWMQNYAALGRFDPKDYSRRIAAIFAEGRIVGRGLATDMAARRLAQGIPWEDAGMPSPHAGNGSAMRAAPVGLLFHDDSTGMIRVACEQGRITHQDTRCSAGAVAIAGAVALSLRPGVIVIDSWLHELSCWVNTVHEEFAGHVRALLEWVHLPPEQAAPLISRCGVPPDFQDDWQWISPFVVSSVLWSLYSFLRTPEDYWETICTAIECGGDVDSTAAMAGAISGAYVGLERLPMELAQRVTDRGTWGFSPLISLAQQCYAIKSSADAE